jgi:hypothetical protein
MAIGALASSAPILYFDDITPPNAYMDVVSRDFKVIYHCLVLVEILFSPHRYTNFFYFLLKYDLVPIIHYCF